MESQNKKIESRIKEIEKDIECIGMHLSGR
jgi:hypothetical protein